VITGFAVAASWVIAAAAIVLGAATLAVWHKPAPALHVALDLLLAAGLLRLSVDASWATVAVSAGIVVLRRMLTRALSTSELSRAAS
jgi:hypothetical protein